MNALIAQWSDWLVVLLGCALWFSGGVSVAMPCYCAHLAFRGGRLRDAEDLAWARRLARLCRECLAPVFFVGAALVLLASVAQPGVFFASLRRLVLPLGASFVLLGGYVILVRAYERSAEKGSRRQFAHLMMMPAGLLAAACAGLVWLFVLCNLDPTLLQGEGAWSLRMWERSALWWTAAYFYASAFFSGGLVLMIAGGRAFRWESRVRASSGARLVVLGAGFSLCFLVIQVAMAGGWLLWRGTDVAREMTAAGGGAFVASCGVGFLCVVLLFETLLGALRRSGNAHRAGVVAIVLLLVLAGSVVSARWALWQGGFPLTGPEAVSAETKGSLR